MDSFYDTFLLQLNASRRDFLHFQNFTLLINVALIQLNIANEANIITLFGYETNLYVVQFNC